MADRKQNPTQENITLFLSGSEFDPQAVVVRLSSPPGGPMVDFSELVHPGGDFDGIPYAELKRMGPGRHEVPAARFPRK